MMKKAADIAMIFIALIVILQTITRTDAAARSQIIKRFCDQQLENNQTQFVSNIVKARDLLGAQMPRSRNGTVHVGTGPDSNYWLAQCYGDLTTEDCILCSYEARAVLPSCYPNNGGRIFFDGCFMRFQNYSFFEENTGPNDTFICGNKTNNNRMFGNTIKRAVSNAAKDASKKNEYFGREQMLVPSTRNEFVYVLADCWRTLNQSSCKACLENASASILKCLPRSEGRVLNTGCFMRYSDTNFLNPLPTTSSSSHRGKIAAIVVFIAVVFTVILMIILYLYIRKRGYIQRKRKASYDPEKMAKILTDISVHFKYSTVQNATGNWDESNKIGQGGFGIVYKGALLDGREIAVKRLFLNCKFRAEDFYNEVNMISSVQHKNLVRLLGCSCLGPESILVYEYLPNVSLDRYIFDERKGSELNWQKRFEIIIGIAEGLVYLHDNTKNRIIHRDIKAANILLDFRLRPKIADFGLAMSFQGDKSHISTAIAGTLGYIAPEYLAYGKLTEKADVYSFGVLLLEIVTGIESNKRKTMEYWDTLGSTAWKHFKQGTVEEIFDPNLMTHISPPNIIFQKDAIRVVHIGLLCIQEAPSLRPSMSTALRMLARNDEPLPVPSNPPFIYEDIMELNMTRNLPSSSVATLSRSHLYPR